MSVCNPFMYFIGLTTGSLLYVTEEKAKLIDVLLFVTEQRAKLINPLLSLLCECQTSAFYL